MAKTKYPISKEFFPYNKFTPPMSCRFVSLAQKGMKVPGFLWKDPALEVQSRMIPAYQGGRIEVFILTPKAYRSPVEAQSHADLPSAYVEVAEFDCLHDDGVLYARLLQEAGVQAELHEVKGTMHGFDTKFHAPTSQAMIARRVAYMKRMFDAHRG